MSIEKSFGLHPFLKRLLVRSVLTADEQQAILGLSNYRVDIKAKQDVVRENETATYCCFIACGLVGRFSQLASGERQITAFHIPGDMADLHSAVRPIGIGGLQTLTDTIILKVPHDEIRRVAARFPAVAEALWRDCMLDAAILMQWVVNVGRRDARTRLAHIFCEMAFRYGNNRAAQLRYALPITQEQLGEAAALTAVHVNRSLKTLREMEMVSLERGEVTIYNWSKLASLADFDAIYLLGDSKPERTGVDPDIV